MEKGPSGGRGLFYLPRVAPPPLELPPPRLAPPPELIPPPENPPPLLRLAPPPELMLPEDRLLELEELLRLLTLPEDRVALPEELLRLLLTLPELRVEEDPLLRVALPLELEELRVVVLAGPPTGRVLPVGAEVLEGVVPWTVRPAEDCERVAAEDCVRVLVFAEDWALPEDWVLRVAEVPLVLLVAPLAPWVLLVVPEFVLRVAEVPLVLRVAPLAFSVRLAPEFVLRVAEVPLVLRVALLALPVRLVTLLLSVVRVALRVAEVAAPAAAAVDLLSALLTVRRGVRRLSWEAGLPTVEVARPRLPPAAPPAAVICARS